MSIDLAKGQEISEGKYSDRIFQLFHILGNATTSYFHFEIF